MNLNRKILMASIALSTLLCAAKPAVSAEDKFLHDDPFEGFNRAMFAFNDVLDIYVLTPVARGYRTITTPSIRARVTSVIDNLKEPMSAVYNLLQGEPGKSANNIGRFAVNSTLGLAGMFDVAGGWGIENTVTNFDKTLATWCTPDGPYVVLPFFGVGTPRSFTGKLVDSFGEPVYWATLNREDGIYASFSYAAIDMINWRESMLDTTDTLRKNSVDYYATMRGAFIQNRNKINVCGNNNAVSYDFDFSD